MNNLQAIQAIRKERQQYEEDEDVLHNRMLHREIIEMWTREYPQEVERLTKINLLDDLAYVTQERMWRTMDEYMDAGWNPADARMQAELDNYQLISPQD